MIVTCDGSDPHLIMYVGIDGNAIDDPEFAVEAITCDCGTVFDDAKHERAWPHRYLKPTPTGGPMVDLPDIMGLF